MVCANDKYTYTNVYILFISLPHYFYKVNIFTNIIVLDSFTIFQTYDFISCDISCDHGHMLLHYPKKNKIKNQIKSNKENKNKIKIKY